MPDKPKLTAGDLVARRRDLVSRLNAARHRLAEVEIEARRARERVADASIGIADGALSASRAARDAADAAVADHRDTVAGLERALATVTAELVDAPHAASDVMARTNERVQAESQAIDAEWREVAQQAAGLVARAVALNASCNGLSLDNEMASPVFRHLSAVRIPHSLTADHPLDSDSPAHCFRGDRGESLAAYLPAAIAAVPQDIQALEAEVRAVMRMREEVAKERELAREAQQAARLAAAE